MRSGLSKKNNEKSTASGKESSRLTMFRGSSLRGRFKVNNEPKAETKKRERGEPSRRPEARREASSCAQSESESQAESTMETELAAQPSQSPGLLVATHQETPAPPLVRAPCSPARQEHHISPNRRPSSFISDCKFCLTR